MKPENMSEEEYRSLVPGIVSDRYRDEVAALMDDPIINRMALEVTESHEAAGILEQSGMLLFALRYYTGECKKRGVDPVPSAIGGPMWAIKALRRRWAKIHQAGPKKLEKMFPVGKPRKSCK